ncbi:PQQ-dependent dehydrogenase, methanol/ethanol family [Parasphingorhabdus halotolerans]|uniref:PQQ-dependent dehydrogenase, methanol/ethanol family n=1 Tax=Parasphingorhabdus halotolerans TaxID=2725558 RepID=A0A6H2DMW6_9SPHN|nr:PQQ-dependent dehydrogenase, methanol/ethanol family [Parasphingorhabdus halotolerans]QJB70009.1 PQQ-dependent dehydrogenase, methanol/ethanol family [Parasphingorhabdus halotolerans]
MRRIGIFAALCLLAACQKAEPGAETTSASNENTEWSNIGFDAKEQRHSPLDKINESNVGELGIAWFKDLPDARGQEATPVVVDGKMYISTAWSKVFAYDAKTGKELWSYDPEVPGEKAVDACCDVVNRGVAISRGKLFFGTIDGRLIALDANTGARLWETQTTDNSKPYTITGAPRVVKNMVIIGNGGAEFGVRGYLTAYDVGDGSQKWRFYTVPNPEGKPDGAASDEIFEKAAAKTWSDGEWKESGGGGTVWDSIVYDEELDQLYFGVGNGNPWNHSLRSGGEGDNLFLSSVVAVNPDTGKYLWHYQETPGENWDYTATQHIIQAELEVGGKMRKVLYHAPKNGFFFVIDRIDGTLISAEPFVDGINWATGYDMATGRPIETPEARYNKTGEPFIAIPGALGAHNWHPMSYNPKTGLVYIPAQQIPQGYINPTSEIDKKRERLGFNVGIGWAIGQLPDDKDVYKAAVASTTGKLVAFNPKTGKVEWSADYPAAWNGGTMTTAGNLVFQGTSVGLFKAYAADSGKELLSLDMQSGIVSAPSTYMIDGEQYVAFLTSKGGAFPLVAGVAGGASRKVPNIPRLVVLKLGGKTQFPALPAKTEIAWNPPEQTGTPAQIADGKAVFGRYCIVCHGDSAIGNGFTPDLRVSGVLPDKEAWASIVAGGALKQHGMVGFTSQVKAEQVENTRLYVIDRSIWTKANLPEMTAPMTR